MSTLEVLKYKEYAKDIGRVLLEYSSIMRWSNEIWVTKL